MEIHLAPDTETQLQHLAASQGKNPEQVVEETVTRMVQRQAEFIAGVRRGVEQADRGESIAHDEVKTRLQRRRLLSNDHPLD